MIITCKISTEITSLGYRIDIDYEMPFRGSKCLLQAMADKSLYKIIVN